MADEHEHDGRDPLVGRLFHDYRIEGQLAKGGMGAVYLCRHRELPHLRKVLKVIASELIEELDPSASPEARANAARRRASVSDRFEREARAVSQLQHRSIVPIDGIDTMDGRRCILMPFLEGKSLDRLLPERGGRLTPHETLQVVVQVARALDYAHRRGIVHRDLKPANIFVTPTEDDPLEIRVIDFGIARQMHAGGTSTASGGPLGTLLFMAVEQFEHASSATPLSDVYSLAVMVYLMVTGRYPWGEHHSAFALYHRQMEEPPDPAPTMPAGWEDIVRSALSPDPARRPRSMRALAYALAEALPATAMDQRTNPRSLDSLTGWEIVHRVAPGWVPRSPSETTQAADGPSGTWHVAASGAWPSGSSPFAVASEPWPEEPTFVTRNRSVPTWELAVLAVTAAVLAGFVVFAVARALEGW